MVIFNSYVKLPEGNMDKHGIHQIKIHPFNSASLMLKWMATTSPCRPVMRHIFPLHKASGPRTGTNEASASETLFAWWSPKFHWIGLRENLNRKPMVFTIKFIGLSGSNFPIIQFYEIPPQVENIWIIIWKSWWMGILHGNWLTTNLYIYILVGGGFNYLEKWWSESQWGWDDIPY